jgi:hypothetical protein
MSWLNFHIIGHGKKRKGKVAKIFGDDKFEAPKKNCPLLTFLLGANFHTMVTKKFGMNMEFFSLYCKFKRKGQKIKKLANLLKQNNNLNPKKT